MAKFGENAMNLGIGKLFNDESLATIRNSHTVQYIDIDKIDVHESNRKYDEKRIEALALDIEDLGLHTPIYVMPVGDRYRVLSGHRRLAAFRLLIQQGKEKFQTIPAIVRTDLDEDKAEEVLIGDNVFTEGLTPAELAKELQRKKDLLQKRRDNGETVPGKLTMIIAKELGISPQTARELDTINRRAEPEIKELFDRGDISQREAYLSSRLPGEEQKQVAKKKKDGVDYLFPTRPQKASESDSICTPITTPTKEETAKGRQETVLSAVVDGVTVYRGEKWIAIPEKGIAVIIGEEEKHGFDEKTIEFFCRIQKEMRF